MPEPLRSALSRCWDPAALYVRARADRVAIREQQCVLFDPKTNSGSHSRASLEALPIINYLRLGIPCLFVYRDMKDRFETAFWTTTLPEVDAIFLPPQRTKELQNYYRVQLRQAWPDTDLVEHLPTNGGSNDPYVVIRREAFMACGVDWQQVFASTADGTMSPSPVPPKRPNAFGHDLSVDQIEW
jgi:hypothetical protein